jgi:protein-S-isoprenylcysteine O-methyltransferase Ste14
MGLTIKNIFVNLFYYAFTLVAVPCVLLLLEARWDSIGRALTGLRIMSIFLGIAGSLLQLWCIILFQRVGKGTPSPAVPTNKLVTQGPYRLVRNPMNIGEVMVMLALAGWFASWMLLVYAVLAWLAFHVFIVTFEETRHLEDFGGDYEEYKRSVNRWLPKL